MPKTFKLTDAAATTFPILLDADRSLTKGLGVFATEWSGAKVEQDVPTMVVIDPDGVVQFNESRANRSMKPPSKQKRRPGRPGGRQSSARACRQAAGVKHLRRTQPIRSALRRGAASVVRLADRAIGNLQQWLIGTYHGVSKAQLQVYLYAARRSYR
jgi:hypothetical protein